MEIKENDIFKVTEILDEYRSIVHEPTHCFEGKFITKEVNGVMLFFDTFWGIGDKSGKYFTLQNVTKYFKIKKLGNMSEFKKCDVRNPSEYYEESDYIILTRQHGCSENCIYRYLRNDANRSQEIMKRSINRKINESISKIFSEEKNIEWLNEKLQKIEAGDTNLHI